jgi:putative radical SAM enzyme (TIGR03279 family)
MPESIANEVGIVPGDKLLTVNGQQLQDIIDLSFALAEENIELVVERQNGERQTFAIEKDYDDDLGIEFESAVFDNIRRCANNCIFCFVDQMPSGMRESLYVKDDDYRLSFLYGNFITLTNFGPADLRRVRQLHLSPLYVSVHTTDGHLRAKMLNNERASKIMDQIKELIDAGVSIHAQIVLCPRINDGAVLERTIADLYNLQPNIESVAVVPVGLTRHREGRYPLAGFTPQEAAQVISLVEKWQQRSRKETGSTFVYLADEFYMEANVEIPEYDFYDGFPQLENGIGLVRSFLAEWQSRPLVDKGYAEPIYIDVVCGVSAAKIFEPLLHNLAIDNLHIRVVPVINEFFGSRVTVTGLLTGQDIINTLSQLPGPRTGVIIPGVALRKGEAVFLDETTPQDIEQALQTKVQIAYFASDLHEQLQAWR